MAWATSCLPETCDPCKRPSCCSNVLKDTWESPGEFNATDCGFGPDDFSVLVAENCFQIIAHDNRPISLIGGAVFWESVVRWPFKDCIGVEAELSGEWIQNEGVAFVSVGVKIGLNSQFPGRAISIQKPQNCPAESFVGLGGGCFDGSTFLPAAHPVCNGARLGICYRRIEGFWRIFLTIEDDQTIEVPFGGFTPISPVAIYGVVGFFVSPNLDDASAEWCNIKVISDAA